MYPKQTPKLLLSLLLSCTLYAPTLGISGEKSTTTPAADTVKVPPVKAKTTKNTKAKPKQSARHPKRGMSMKQVRKHYGEPKSIRKSKGKVKKLWPRISVWNYGTYSVYFERHLVLHTVVH